jgi:uncharacterized protein YecE (DUF72 family)
LHGRKSNYDYLYNAEELKIWAEKIGKISKTAKVTYVVMNNTPGAKAVVNGLQLKFILNGDRVKAPESLLRAYPELRQIADPLFDAGSMAFPA